VQIRLSDRDTDILTSRGINPIRVLPNGIVNWGARTNAGDDTSSSQWKYIPVRRLALFIEESLYRGLNWAVSQPNDESLWAQIRLNVGDFLQSLFQQGAFQGASPQEAYFVKCDAETTSQEDRNRGVANISVGFAPLKPAEFVVLRLQQMVDQGEV
jgi:phage tail sheath protein FI